MPHEIRPTWTGTLPCLPGGVRVMLTAFLIVVGSGYLVAVANIFHSHQMADGRPGLTIDDIRVVYSGLTVRQDSSREIPSRMLTMLRSTMRQYVKSDDEFRVLELWLAKGAKQDEMDQGVARMTPRRVIIRNCLRCHAQSTGTQISKEAPFGYDEFEVDYALIAPLAAAKAEAGETTVRTPPQYTIPRLVLVSHVHMLAIPLFTVVVGWLFALTRWPTALKGLLTPLPMLAVAADFAGWWLARIGDGFVYLIAGAGAVFGLAFGLQIIAVLIDLWTPMRSPPRSAPA